MSSTELSIELLERLASKGEIDPWDVDIVDAMDRCLADLEGTDRQNLRLCGRALLCATILLHLKADAMGAEMDDLLAPPAAEPEDDWFSFDEPAAEDPADSRSPQVLDLALIRRANARQPRRRRVTLVELIAELRRMEKEAAVAAPDANVIRRSRGAELQARTVGLAHEEDLEGDAQRLAEHLALRFQAEPAVSFTRLATAQPDDRGLFLALMFLAHWGVLEIQQSVPYGDLILRQAEKPSSGESSDASTAAA